MSDYIITFLNSLPISVVLIVLSCLLCLVYYLTFGLAKDDDKTAAEMKEQRLKKNVIKSVKKLVDNDFKTSGQSPDDFVNYEGHLHAIDVATDGARDAADEITGEAKFTGKMYELYERFKQGFISEAEYNRQLKELRK